jgi:hypothetical protein
MKIRLLALVLAFGMSAVVARAQEPPKPGPEHEKLKELVGDWDCTIKFGNMEAKGAAVYKLDFGGFYLIEQFEGDFGGMKFRGRGQMGYCPLRQKYITMWIDSMSPSPMVMIGTFDKDGKTLTEEGEGPNHEGKMTKMKTVSTMTDKDTVNMTMYEVKDGKDTETMSIVYKRKK